MVDITLFAKNGNELETLILAVRQDIGMEFGKEKCAMQVMKSGKRHITDRTVKRNQDKTIKFGKTETYKYLVILEAGTIKQEEIKEKKLKKNISEKHESYSR